MEPPTPTPSEFRFQGKRILLTYKGHLDKVALAEFIQRKLKCPAQVKICHETGDTGYKHTHCAVQSPKKPNIRDATFFDYEGVHPNIKPPRDNDHWREQVNYIDKQDEEVFGSIEIEPGKEEKFKLALDFVKSCATWQQVLQCSDIPTLMLISSKLPFFQQVHQNLGSVRVEKPKYQLTDFDVPALDITKPTLLWGASGVGKTEYALAHFSKPLFVSNIDDLNKFQEGYHDGIVFDDIDFSHFPPTAVIHLVDIDHTRTIKCRYFNATIPCGTARIFTSNVQHALEPPNMPEEQRKAIERRLYKQRVDTPLWTRP